MRTTGLRCTACNGILELNENNPNIIVCEYCHTKYVIEDADSDYARLETPPPNWYAPQNSGSSSSEISSPPGGEKATGWGPYGWKRGTAPICIGLVLVSAINAKRLIRRWNMNYPKKSSIMMDSQAVKVMGEEEEDLSSMPDTPFTGAFTMMAEAAYGKPADEIMPQELEKFQWLTTKYIGMDSVLAVGYSYNDPYTSSTASLTWVPLSRDTAKLDTSQLARFTGLKRLDLSGSISSGDLSGLPIRGIGCYNGSPAELAERLGGAAVQLREVNITASLESLDGITAFIGAEKMSIYGGHPTDITMLANLKNVTSLILGYCDDVTDFSVLLVMPWLKELSIESEGLWDIGFVSEVPELAFLTLEDTSILYVNRLENNTTLTSLSINRCEEMKDCDAISGLARLRKLFLGIPYGYAEPNLNGPTGLTEPTVSGFDNIGFLRNMPQLTMPTLDECQVNDAGAFTGLTGLKELNCSRVYGDLTNWSFVGGISGLEALGLNGVSTYEDVSSLFLTPTPQELYLNGTEHELNFSKLAVNESLTTLEIDGMKFYTDVEISGGGGIYSIDYDRVSLDRHTDFLTDCPNLKNLSLTDNALTNVDFASSLGALEILNISENYVTDLRPLETLKALKMVDSTSNPIENYRVLGDDVPILK